MPAVPRIVAIVLPLILFAVAATADERPAPPAPLVKEITGIPLPHKADFSGSVEKPAVITDEAALAKHFPDDKTRAKLAELVDFDKQHLLLFQWSGSGGDRLTARVEASDSEQVIIFDYTPGLTRDLRQHAKLFAVTKGIAWKVQTKLR